MSEEEVTTEVTTEPSVEDQARNLGWVPEDEWTGPEGKWKPAEDFVGAKEHALHDNKILQSKLSKVEQDMVRMTQMFESQIERQKSEYEAKLAQRERKAVEEADMEEYERVQAEKKAVSAPQQPAIDPAYQDFIANSPWWNVDREKTAKAMGLDAQYSAMGYTPAQIVEKINEEFSKKPVLPKTTPSVNKPAPKAAKKDGFESLTEQDKAMYKRQVERLSRANPDFDEKAYKAKFVDMVTA